ncbi:4F5 domain-containing protein/zf-met2 domain-containing protein [Senna tora]|uniref:4F5 domain-containing protein/zf-met2 domain-containing protein n=1 Tax=Senna tora TaxID=362788 RepID=A0A834SWV3_9FABA|nr:4F5 domain-containing protein/zf-met2 domain-containing protein [Senna tora]
MGGGNGQKAKMARERNMEKQKAANKGSQLESNKKAMTIQDSVFYFSSGITGYEKLFELRSISLVSFCVGGKIVQIRYFAFLWINSTFPWIDNFKHYTLKGPKADEIQITYPPFSGKLVESSAVTRASGILQINGNIKKPSKDKRGPPPDFTESSIPKGPPDTS